MRRRYEPPTCRACTAELLPSEYWRATWLERHWNVNPAWSRVCGLCCRFYRRRARRRAAGEHVGYMPRQPKGVVTAA